LNLEKQLLNKRIEIKISRKKKPDPAEDTLQKKIDRIWLLGYGGATAVISITSRGCKGSEQSDTACTSDGSPERYVCPKRHV
jgi:hypothetical protein